MEAIILSVALAGFAAVLFIVILFACTGNTDLRFEEQKREVLASCDQVLARIDRIQKLVEAQRPVTDTSWTKTTTTTTFFHPTPDFQPRTSEDSGTRKRPRHLHLVK